MTDIPRENESANQADPAFPDFQSVVAEISPSLLAELDRQSSPDSNVGGDSGSEQIPKGQRNNFLASLAGTMRKRGMSQPAIEAALLQENKRCDPPLSESEVLAIARSISRY